MGECLIVRRGGNLSKLPVLNENYPQDVTVVASASASATFSVQIAEPGNPAEYTYKWYRSGNMIAGATGASVTLSGLTAAQTATVYCEVTNKAGTVTSRVAALTVKDWKPVYTYTGSHQLIDDGSYHWRIKFLTSGMANFATLGNVNSIDVFCVGGGSANAYGKGGSGGATATQKSVAIEAGTDYAVTIGAGAQAGNDQTLQGKSGGDTTAFGVTGDGGKAAGGTGSGGGGAGYVSSKNVYTAGGNGGTNGGSGGGHNPTAGQGTTTREFGETGGDLYSGGGGGYDAERSNHGTGGEGGGANAGKSAAANTGGGAGGGNGQYQVWGGGSGIVVIRDHR